MPPSPRLQKGGGKSGRLTGLGDVATAERQPPGGSGLALDPRQARSTGRTTVTTLPAVTSCPLPSCHHGASARQPSTGSSVPRDPASPRDPHGAGFATICDELGSDTGMDVCLTGAGHRDHPGPLGALSGFRHASPCMSGFSKLVPPVAPLCSCPESHPHSPLCQGLPFNGFPFHWPKKRTARGNFVPLWTMRDDCRSPRERRS